YCPPGDFYIDPWQPVAQAVLTHAHADHARPGCLRYLIPAQGGPVFRTRLGANANLYHLPYGGAAPFGGVLLTFIPPGHILGSAQVRIEYQGQVWVVSGDYKLESDPTCAPFESVPCDVFVTESTFGLPGFHWPPQAEVFAQINDWWRDNQEQGKASVLF